jgi:hypothetical protein
MLGKKAAQSAAGRGRVDPTVPEVIIRGMEITLAELVSSTPS